MRARAASLSRPASNTIWSLGMKFMGGRPSTTGQVGLSRLLALLVRSLLFERPPRLLAGGTLWRLLWHRSLLCFDQFIDGVGSTSAAPSVYALVDSLSLLESSSK